MHKLELFNLFYNIQEVRIQSCIGHCRSGYCWLDVQMHHLLILLFFSNYLPLTPDTKSKITLNIGFGPKRN